MRTLAQLRQLLEQDPPAVHGVGTYGLSWEAAEAIAAFIQPGATTAETGAGMSTIVIAGLGARHLAITPTEDEALKIRAWLQRNHLATDTLTFDHRLSWDALPAYSQPKLDFALIDGCHGFPAPFIDFFYFSRNLKLAGILAVDDVQLWTGKVLMDFLKSEPSWEFVSQAGKTAFFRKRRDLEWNEWEWDRQPFVARQSRPALSGRVLNILDLGRRAVRHLLTGDLAKLKRAFSMLLGRDVR